ncbi:MAG: hypothetical protein J6V29_05945 [Bacteroidales bacterium]|nr:hypothetical protein [Bacteroidales bacterium]
MIKNTVALYFSPTHTTKRIVCTIAQEIAQRMGLTYTETDITPASYREEPISFNSGDLVIFYRKNAKPYLSLFSRQSKQMVPQESV